MQPADTPMPPRLPPAPKRPAGMETPLVGVRVVDFTHFIAGPFATLILADFGAEVIKIENAEEGDAFRTYPPLLGGEGAPYLWTNRNKASVALDLKTADGRATALALMEKADIVVENFSTGVMARPTPAPPTAPSRWISRVMGFSAISAAMANARIRAMC